MIAITRRRGAWERGAALLLVAVASLPSGVLGQEAQALDQEVASKFRGQIYLMSNGQDDPLRGVVAVDPNNGTRRKVSKELGQIRVSPDGSRLAVPRNEVGEPDPGIWIYPTTGENGSGEFRVSEKQGRVCWSPDGKSILVTEGARGRETGVWRVDADGSHEERLLIPAGEFLNDWSPDGRWLLTHSSRKLPDRPLYLIHPDGTGEHPLLASSDSVPEFGGRISSLAFFSPDSRKVITEVFVTDNRPPRSPGSYLLMLDVDGGRPRRFLEREAGSRTLTPHWSPDGKSVGMVVHEALRIGGGEPDKTHIEIVDLDGNVLKTIPLPAPSKLRFMIGWR